MAKTDLETLVVRLEAQMRTYEKEWARIRGVTDRQASAIEKRAQVAAASVAKSMSSLATLATGSAAGMAGALFGGLAGAASGAEFIRASIEAEKVAVQLEAVIRSTGGAAGYTSDELTAMAAELQKVTTFGDETIMSGQALLLTFTSIGRDVFPQALEAAMNMSVALGTDLNSAALQVGKALQDPIVGLTALRRAGVSLSEGQRETIRTLVESGQKLEAQKIILRELETEFGNSARAARETLGGALTSLQNAFGDLFEQPRENTAELRKEIEALIDVLQSPDVKDGFLTLGQGIVSQFAQILREISDMYASARALADAIKRGDIAGALREFGPNPTSSFSSRFGEWPKVTVMPNKRPAQPETPEAPSGGRSAGGGGGSGNDFSRDVERLNKRIALMNSEIETMGRSTEERERARVQTELLNAAQQAGLPITEAMRAKIDELAERYAKAAAKAQEARERIARLNELSREFGSTLADAFKDAVIEGKKFNEILASILNRLSSRTIDSAFDAFFSPRSSGGTSPFISLMTNMFGGGRAAGGPVSPGKYYVVGERGPEILMPRSPGFVVPNMAVRGAGAGGNSVTAPIAVTVDARGASGRDAEAIAAAIERRLSAQIVPTVREAIRRGAL